MKLTQDQVSTLKSLATVKSRVVQKAEKEFEKEENRWRGNALALIDDGYIKIPKSVVTDEAIAKFFERYTYCKTEVRNLPENREVVFSISYKPDDGIYRKRYISRGTDRTPTHLGYIEDFCIKSDEGAVLAAWVASLDTYFYYNYQGWFGGVWGELVAQVVENFEASEFFDSNAKYFLHFSTLEDVGSVHRRMVEIYEARTPTLAVDEVKVGNGGQ